MLNRIIILLFFFFISCGKETTALEFEKNVMTQLLPSLIDSTCIDSRIMHNFPPKYGESIYDKEGHYIGVDSTKATQEDKENLVKWERRNLEIENDTSKIIVAFNPKLKFDTAEYLKITSQDHFKGVEIENPSSKEKQQYVFDFHKIKLNRRFELRDITKFPERDKIWDTKYKFNFSGIVYFSRIQFDKEKRYGILNAGFFCGDKCGQGFRIYIKKIGNEWVIDKVDPTWIS